MPIKRNSDQKSTTLEEFYMNLSKTSTNSYADVGKRMLSFIEVINQEFNETLIWGLICHSRLVIKSEDNWNSDWLVIVSNIGMEEYHFEYLIPASKQPWKNATVRGQADSLEVAKKYLLIAMNESGGWNDSLELKNLLMNENMGDG